MVEQAAQRFWLEGVSGPALASRAIRETHPVHEHDAEVYTEVHVGRL